MKYIILGQPRNGKSTLAQMISKEKNIPINSNFSSIPLFIKVYGD